MKKSARTFNDEHIAAIVKTINENIDAEAPTAKVLAGGQHKVGDIPRWNLPPLVTCGGNCKACKEHCYVLKDYTGPRKKAVAKACPDTRFLAFTKAYDIVRKVPFYELDNFSLVLSEWTDVLKAPDDLKEHYRTSRAVEKLEDAKANEVICPGNCETCGMCWALKSLEHDVAFEIH